MKKNIVIVGAGLVGSLLACYLSRRGHRVYVFERRGDFRKAGYLGGRSINLALSDRGWRGLEGVGLRQAVEQIAIPMKGRMIHQPDGQDFFQPYSADGQYINSVSRAELNLLMIREADAFANVQFYFSQRCAGVDFEKNLLTFENTETGARATVHADLIFGADGAFSELRYEMQKLPGFNFSQTHETYGYKELNIPAAAGGGHLIEKNALHIWPRKSFMMIALPNIDGSFTCTLFAPHKGENGFSELTTDAGIQQYFEKHFASALPLMPTLLSDFKQNPNSMLVTIRCFPWSYKRFCLIGDAAHGIVPFYGQGMNCGFEDVCELDGLLTQHNEDWERVFQQYENARKPNGDAIADLALYNYIEMRDLSGREDFQLRLKIEKHLAQKFPGRFRALYSMVTFSHTPYSEAKEVAEQQGELLDAIMRLPDVASCWESDAVLQMAEAWLKEKGW